MSQPAFRRFLVAGTLTVGVDLAVYHGLMSLSMPMHAAKGCGFMAGVLFAYVINKQWTFNITYYRGMFRRFVCLYLLTLCVNVTVNAACAHMLSPYPYALSLAFVLATGTSAGLNFLGMRFLVFS